MKKFLYFTMLYFAFSNSIKSQEFAPIGATWHYSVSRGAGAVLTYRKWTVVSDSNLVEGNYYKIIEEIPIPPVIHSSLSLYIREEDEKIYILNSAGGELLMWDKSPELGDIWYYPYKDSMDVNFYYTPISEDNPFDTIAQIPFDSIALRIETITDTVFNGHTAKIIGFSKKLRYEDAFYFDNNLMTYSNNPDLYIFEPFGFLQTLFLFGTTSWNDYEIPVRLNCYEDNYWGLIHRNSPFPCNYINGVGFEEIKEIEIQVYPNPSKDNIYITINQQGTYHLKIYNTIGLLITQSSIGMGTTTINLQSENISAGLYFVEISNEQQQRLKTERIMVNSQ